MILRQGRSALGTFVRSPLGVRTVANNGLTADGVGTADVVITKSFLASIVASGTPGSGTSPNFHIDLTTLDYTHTASSGSLVANTYIGDNGTFTFNRDIQGNSYPNNLAFLFSNDAGASKVFTVTVTAIQNCYINGVLYIPGGVFTYTSPSVAAGNSDSTTIVIS